ncbi:BTAD domain-containing putative transcriptional regulator [Lentzea sp. NPDC005914]|uniref:BTAD domain-containing putative transcriptional regulator n=1 Tax=Lentzea sp. NPDC005914 TaxID=3154572 RepID=UPI0034019DDE
MRVSIRVLGAFEVRIDDTTVDVGGPTQQALLAVLASKVDAPMATDEIASALWGARLPARHRQQVQKRVHMLRARLGAEVVTTDGDGYRLSCSTDLHEFTHRLSHARALRAGQDLGEAATAYRSALALWRGPALDGLARLPELAARLDDLRGQATSEHQELGHPSRAALPLESRTFVGRVGELAALTGPLSLVTGPPGVGKTALAIRWAHRADFPDGKFYLNLHGFDAESPVSPDEALRSLLRALGVQQVPRELDDQVALYRSLLAGRRVLVVLDNASSEDQVRPLLPADPSCAAVVTSRNDLRGLVALNDAHRLALEVLSPSDACALVESLTGSSDNASELARLCGYLPLALRVAATSRAPISDAVTALANAPLVTAAFEFSYRALDGTAARLFRLLGLVPRPSFTPRAASALLGMDAGSALAELERASLVERHRRHRYRMHDLLHAYARDLATAELDALPRLLDHYLQTTDAASDLVTPQMIRRPRPTAVTFDTRADAAEWLDDEYENVLAAALASPPGRTWQLADALRRHLWLMGHFTQSLRLFSTGLAAAVAEQDLVGQATMHSAAGTAHMADDAALAATEFRTAADLYGQAGDSAGRFYALHNVSRCTGMRGQVRETLAVLRSALPLATTPRQHADLRTSMAITLGYAGRLHDALRCHEEELHYRGETDETALQPATMLSICFVTRQLGRLDRSAAMLARLEKLASGTGDSVWRLHALATRASLARDTGETASALAALDELLPLSTSPSTQPFAPAAYMTLGQLQSHAGRHSLALTTLLKASQLADSLQYAQLAPGILVDLARVHLSLGSLDAARDHASRAFDLASDLGLLAHQGRALVTLAHLGSRSLAAQALELHQESGFLLGQAEAHLALGVDDQAGAIFALFTGCADHAPAGVLTGRPCHRCADAAQVPVG